jgi:Flp pilus assembly protein TadB
VIPAVLAGLAVWCVIPVSTVGRQRALFGGRETLRRMDTALVAAVLTPVAATVVLGLPLGPLIGVGLAPVVHRSMSRLETASDRRRSARIAAQLPTALDLMVAALEVGRPPVTAFELAAQATDEPLGTELGLVAGRLAIAGDSEAVWRTLAGDPSLAPVGRAFRRAAASGMPVAHVVSGVADDLRRERRAARRERSRKVAVRTAAPLGACFLPAFFLIGIVPTIIATFRSFSL